MDSIIIMSSLEELETQLNEIQQLLSITPNDDGLIQLENDLKELIQLTSSTGAEVETNSDQPTPNDNQEDVTITTTEPDMDTTNVTTNHEENDAKKEVLSTKKKEEGEETNNNKKKKKKKKTKQHLSNFEVPSHLVPHDTDTPAEASRKKRTLKTLKNKWREQKKAQESHMKQQSWKDFQKSKSSSTTTRSMFSSSTSGKVGVVQATTTTNNHTSSKPSRKRLWQDA